MILLIYQSINNFLLKMNDFEMIYPAHKFNFIPKKEKDNK